MRTLIVWFWTIVSMWSIFLRFRVLNLDVNRWFGLICLRLCQLPKMLLPFFVNGILRSALLQRTCVSCSHIIWSLCCCRSALPYSSRVTKFSEIPLLKSVMLFHKLQVRVFFTFDGKLTMINILLVTPCRQWWTAHGTRCGQVVCPLTAP